MAPIISIQNLSKRYRLGAHRGAYRYGTLREAIVGWFRTPVNRIGAFLGADDNSHAGRQRYREEIWALRNLSFDLKAGEVLGIIGRNGAGKSTLLKIISRITEPTEGRIQLRGRVGSLLEVGTGFHPELTGRENILLSGAILGMKRTEVARNFDKIVAFAEVEDFVDTPVKRYSSGMYVRLAFAVAAHLETEILVVDEVLAVGDVAFQKKCIGKMDEVARHGRTILFVSHNMASIESLCSSCILLGEGKVASVGKPASVIAQYMATVIDRDAGYRDLTSHPGRKAGSSSAMTSVELRGDGNPACAQVRMGAELMVRVSFQVPRPLKPVLGIGLKTTQGVLLFNVSERWSCQLQDCPQMASGTVICQIEHLPLLPGRYVLDLWLGDQGGDFDIVFDAISFEVVPADLLGSGRLPPTEAGPLFCKGTWSVEQSGHTSDSVVVHSDLAP